MRKAFLIFGLLLSLFHGLFGQSLLVEEISPLNAAAFLTDPNGGVEIIGVTYHGNPDQLGKFTNGAGTGIGIDEGILLTTGQIVFATREPGATPHQEYSLEPLAWPNPVLTIIFRAGGKHANFDFVFASTEYPTFVDQYNDEFSFEVVGPGIDGAVNYAVIPGTEIPISINTVNGGNDLNQVANGDNMEYFVSNYTPVGTHDIVYHGFTTVIPIDIPTFCDSVYFLRIKIANGGSDDAWDSAVFLKKGSLKSEYQIGELTVTPNPVCVGEDITLTVEANPDGELYTYEWSTGQTGIGLNSITIPATIGQDYSVIVDPDDRPCVFERTTEVAVHPQNNQPPYTTGVNGSGEYTAYFQAGQPNCFTVQTVDNPAELVDLTGYDNYPIFMNQPQEDNAPQQSATFCWTPEVDDYGEYTFTINYQDNNACQIEPNSDEITVFVACPYCPLHVEYDNRTPTNNPLPPLTEAGEWIKAGLVEHVAVGNDQVVFRAPHIYLGGENGQPGLFDSGPNFIAEAEPACLADECDDCCADWQGFTWEDPGDEPTITPNGDFCNEVWYLRDSDHPVGAFGAVGFRLKVYSAGWGVVIYELTEQPGYCYPFHAPSTQPAPCPVFGPQPYSSIYWPGITNTVTNNECYVNDGLYPYTLELMNPCSNSFEHVLGGSIWVLSSPGPTSCDPSYKTEDPDSTDVEETPEIPLAKNEPESISFTYDPQTGKAVASMLGEGELQVAELYAMDGRLLFKNDNCGSTCAVNVTNMSPGIYLLRAASNNGLVETFKFWKQ